MIGLLLVAIIVLLLILLVLLLRIARKMGESGTARPTTPPATGVPVIPDTLTGPAVASLLKTRLAGTPADGSPSSDATPATVIWVDRGDEVLVHLDSTTTQIAGNALLVSIDLETDQTGRTPLVVAFALGDSDAAGLVVATDAFPRGNGALAARWGSAVQAAAWSALLSLASDHAGERGLAPRGLAISGGALNLIAGAALKIA